MPIASTLAYLQQLLDGLPMPGSLPPMNAFAVPPPDPNTESDIPTVYIWPTAFDESRDTSKGGSSMPRNTGPGTFSGVKMFTHEPHLFIIWMGANDDPSFPGIVDFTMKALRFAYPMPTQVTDPNDGTVSQINDVGEVQRGQIYVRALEDEAYNRYDCELTVPVIEEISA